MPLPYLLHRFDPVNFGIRKSINMMSGLSSSAFFIATAPFSASPTTSIEAFLESIAASPSEPRNGRPLSVS
jgi:hypothetical protein